MYGSLRAASRPTLHRRGFSSFDLYTFVILLSLLLAEASPNGVVEEAPDGRHLMQDTVNSLTAAGKALTNTGDDVAQIALMRRAGEKEPINSNAEHSQDDSEDDSDDDALDDQDDANDDLESSLVEKSTVRRCTTMGQTCRRRRANLCKRENCGAAAKSFYRQPKSTYHCTRCRNLAYILAHKYRGLLTQIGKGASLISRGTVDNAEKEQLLSVEEMRQMPTEALTELVESGQETLCSFRNSFAGCALQKSFSGQKVYRCGKCWRSRWYPKNHPNVFNPYSMAGPPGPPGPPGPSSHSGSHSRHRRRRRGGNRRRRRHGKSRRSRGSSLVSASEESSAEDEEDDDEDEDEDGKPPKEDGLDEEMSEGFSEAS